MKVLCFKNILREIRSHLYISKMCAFTMLKKCIQKLPAMFMICVIVWYCGCTCSAVCIVKVYPLIDTQHHDRCVGVEQAVKLIIRYCRRLGYTELQHSLRPVLVTTRTLKFYQTSLSLSLSLSLSPDKRLLFLRRYTLAISIFVVWPTLDERSDSTEIIVLHCYLFNLSPIWLCSWHSGGFLS